MLSLAVGVGALVFTILLALLGLAYRMGGLNVRVDHLETRNIEDRLADRNARVELKNEVAGWRTELRAEMTSLHGHMERIGFQGVAHDAPGRS